MTKAVVKKEETSIQVFEEGMGINAQDIVLPSITLRQNSFRKDFMKPFKPGDLIMRPENKLVAKEDKPAMFVPVSIEKCYRICDITKDVRTIGYEPWGLTDLPPEEQRGEIRIRRDRAYVAHVLFREDLEGQAAMFERIKKGETVDPSDFTLPCRIVFTRSSFQAGKVLNTHFELSRPLKQSPASITFQLKSVETTNDKGTWYSLDVQKVKDAKVKYTPKELIDGCNFWVQSMTNASKLKAHEGDDDITAHATEVVEDITAHATEVVEDRF
jgi:hypothetical protein